jgi:hypothetical protein
MVFAQSAVKSNNNNAKAAVTAKTPTVAFNDKVNEFATGIKQDNMTLAKQRFEDLKMIMTDDLHSLKPKIANAANAKEKDKWMQTLNAKQNIYFEIINAASDMKGNSAVMVKKYREYAKTL